MIKTVLIVLLTLPALNSAFAADSQPSESSVRELITVMESRRQVDAAIGQIDSMIQDTLEQSLGSRTVTVEQQQILDAMRTKIMSVYRAELGWERLEPMFVEIYRSSFTQDEVDSMLMFYRSEPGQAVIAKMPIVMQNTLRLMRVHMTAMAPKVQRLQRETVAQLWATKHK